MKKTKRFNAFHDPKAHPGGGEMALGALLRTVIETGRLTVIDAAGRRETYGAATGPAGGHEAAIRLHTRAAQRRILRNPGLALGEAYMDGDLTVESAGLHDLLAILTANAKNAQKLLPLRMAASWRFFKRRWDQRNTRGRAGANVRRHYDLSGELYELFLDADRFYSCAYFEGPEEDIDTAQARKARHIAAKLRLSGQERVLDIGCGWGSLAIHLAHAGAGEIDGVTLSHEQHAYARDWAKRAGLSNRIQFDLKDYRDLKGPYDRIVSVGMFEHVGVGHYRAFFAALRDLLAPDGVALIHSIMRFDGPGYTSPWLAKYIFPGGYIPAVSEVIPEVERAGLKLTDLEVLRLHYAFTLRRWWERFQANRDGARALYDERFCRMWEFYLAGSEMAFRYGDMMVGQLQLVGDQNALPLTRDYMVEAERSAPLVPALSRAF